MIKPIGVKLDGELYARLKTLSERCDRSPHWLMKKAISEYVDRMEAEENERKLLIERWNNYKETEEAVSHKEVVQWLDSWGTDKESAYPTNQN